MIRNLSVLLLVVPFLASIAAAAPPDCLAALDACNVVWTTPSKDAAGSMPIGNGEVVLNVWVEQATGDLLLLVARTDALSETCRFLKLGRVRVHLDGSPLATAKDFKQELRLYDGIITIAGGGMKLQVFVDRAAHVVHVAGQSESPRRATATVECWRNAEQKLDAGDSSSWTTHGAPFPRVESADVFLPGEKQSEPSVTWYHRNEHSVVPKLLETQSLVGAKGAFDPLLHRTFGGQLAGKGFIRDGARGLKTAAPLAAFDLRLATHTAQTYTVDAWLAGLRKEAEKSTDTAATLVRTRACWAAFWERSWVVVRETRGLSANSHPLRVGVDSAGGNRFQGQLDPLPVLPAAQTAAQVADVFAKGRTEGGVKIVPQMPAGAASLTFSAWIKPAALVDGRIFDKVTAGGSDGFLFDTHPGNGLRLIVGNTILLAPNVLKSGAWQLATATIDASGALAIYLDGKRVAEQPGGSSAVTQGYTLQRFVQGCQGRGAYPIKFNGGFYTIEHGASTPDWRQWGDCYWWQNTRHMYHPMLAGGDFDLMAPLFRMYESVVPLAESRTAKYHNAQGAYFPETMTLFGTYGGDYAWNRKGLQPKDVQCPWWQYAWNQGPELVALMLDRYDWTEDAAFLKAEALPMAEAVLRYFDSRFKKDAQGKLVIQPTQSVETYWHDVVNDAPTVAGLANITRRLTALPEALTTPEQRSFFTKMRAACPAIPVEGAAGARKLSPAEKYNPARSNCENPELYAVWPYREVSLARPKLLAEGRAAYAQRKSNLPNGWGYDGNVAALLGLTDEAARILAIKCANSNRGFRWPATWGPNFDWLPDQNHGGNLLETTQLMLLQGEAGGKILLLPAWPKDWDVSFKLRAPGNTVVECEYRGGKVRTLNVTPPSRAADVVLPPGVR